MRWNRLKCRECWGAVDAVDVPRDRKVSLGLPDIRVRRTFPAHKGMSLSSEFNSRTWSGTSTRDRRMLNRFDVVIGLTILAFGWLPMFIPEIHANRRHRHH
jgi:hypothetical protein